MITLQLHPRKIVLRETLRGWPSHFDCHSFISPRSTLLIHLILHFCVFLSLLQFLPSQWNQKRYQKFSRSEAKNVDDISELAMSTYPREWMRIQIYKVCSVFMFTKVNSIIKEFKTPAILNYYVFALNFQYFTVKIINPFPNCEENK